MKRNLLVLISGTILLITACSKKSETVETPVEPKPEEGYWQGTYNTKGVLGNNKAAIVVKPGGVLRYYELGTAADTSSLPELAKVTGVWTLNGNSFQCSYPAGSKTVNATMIINAAKNQLSGTWGWGAIEKGSMQFSK